MFRFLRKSTTRISDLRNVKEALKDSSQDEHRKGGWLETLYYPLRKIEEAIWNAGS
ncbi:MAG TPA: hypothetical protein PKG77_17575 [Phycisphaerae bacterium]|nr:hypothetical protein [Phycisphaerae bacterium]HQL71901.1 hypothetical protein [Phycisphaerae bacterium]